MPTIHLPQRDKVILESSRVGKARGDAKTHFYYMHTVKMEYSGLTYTYPIRQCDWVRVDKWEFEETGESYPTCKKCQKLVNRVLENELEGRR